MALTESERLQALDDLETALDAYVERRTRQLRAERAFLASVKRSLADGAIARATVSDRLLAVNRVGELLGVE